MSNIEDGYKIKLDKDQGLFNGDKIKVFVSVDEERNKEVKGGEKEVTVKDLEEPKKLSTQEVEENLVLNFIGPSGKGIAKIENNGKLKNGDLA